MYFDTLIAGKCYQNNQNRYCFSGDLVPEQNLLHKDALLNIHSQRETIQVLSTEQENVFQN